MNPQFLTADIFDLMGMTNLSEDKKTALLIKMNEILSKKISYRIMDQLSEEDQAKFDQMIADNASMEKVNEFLNGKVDLDRIVVEETTQFKERLSGDFNAIVEALNK